MPIFTGNPFPNDLILSHKLLSRLDRNGNVSVKNFAKNFLLSPTPPHFLPLKWKLSTAVIMTVLFVR